MHQSEVVNTRLKDHFDKITHGAKPRAIAIRAGIQPSTFSRQLNGEVKMTVQTIIAIARAYNAAILPALIAGEVITEEEAREIAAGGSLTEATDRQLVEEMLRRVVEGEDHEELTDPVDQGLIDNVTSIRATGEDVTGLTEDELSEMDKAANTDNSDEKLDPELT